MDRRCIIWRFGELFFIVIGVYAVCSTLVLQAYLDPFLRFWSASSQIKSRELLENVCEPGFTLEKHKGDLHHGDVCRATDRTGKFSCPTGCFNPGKDDGAFCESLDSYLPCRVPTAQLPKHNGSDLHASSLTCKSSIADLDLLLPIHHKDAPFAAALFKSIELHLPCFHDLILVVPPESRFILHAVAPPGAKLYVVPDPLPPRFGYLSQQVIKIFADKFTTGSRVMILETDMVFKSWHDGCFFADRNTIRTFCVEFKRDKASDIWKVGTENAVGAPVTQDCVVNTPFVFPRNVFAALRDHVKRTKGKTWGEFMEEYFEGHSKGWVRESLLFSEFNILAHFMLKNLPEQVELVTTADKHWHMVGKCSRHVGAEVKRNHQLPNPKLTAEYFDIAFHTLDGEIQTLDLQLDLDTHAIAGVSN